MANQLFHQSLKKKLLDLFSFNFQLKESDDNKLQGGAKVQELTFMNYYYSNASSSFSTQQEDENKLGYYSICHQTTDKSNGMSSETSINEVSFIRRDYYSHGHVRVSKVEKKKCRRCSRSCKYYSTKTKSTAAGSVSTMITCPSCGKKFDPKATLSVASKLATKSSLHWQKQDHRSLSLQVR